MSDMNSVIVPKSDQWNADDFLAGSRTFKIAGTQVRPGTEQPVSIELEGSSKVFRPCKSMCRVMVNAWGADSSSYVGKSMTLYRDPKVKWGGMEIGGIRIGAMSHIDSPMTMALSESKAVRKPFTVKPLELVAPTATASPESKAQDWLDGYLAAVDACEDLDALVALQTKQAKALGKLAGQFPLMHEQAVLAGSERATALDANVGADA